MSMWKKGVVAICYNGVHVERGSHREERGGKRKIQQTSVDVN